MTIDDKIRGKKLKYYTNNEAAKGIYDQYEYRKGEEVSPPNQSQVIQHAKLTYSHLESILEK